MFESLVRVEEDGDYWRLVAPLAYRGAWEYFEIPVGFRTDFASIPWWATWLLPRTGKHNRAAVAHDYLVRSPHLVSRLDADRIFLRMLRELGTPEWSARLMYLGVRLGVYLRL